MIPGASRPRGNNICCFCGGVVLYIDISSNTLFFESKEEEASSFLLYSSRQANYSRSAFLSWF